MNLSDGIDFDLKRFFRWWGRELAFLIPEKLKQALSDKTGYLYIRVSEQKFRIIGTLNSQTKTIADLDFNEEGLSQFKQLLESHGELKRARLVLSLTSEQAIQKIIQLPAVAKENIEQVVAFELDKHTPFNNEQVYFSLKQQGKEESGHINIQIILTPKERLDALFFILNKSDVRPEIIEYENAANNYLEDYDTYNLLPEWERPAKNKVAQAIIGTLSLLVLLLTTSVFVYPVWQQGQAVERLKKEIKSLKNDTDFVQEKQLELSEIIEETEKIKRIKQRVPDVLKLIDMLSELINDETWLTHLQLKNDRVQIQGQSAAAEGLIGVLETSNFFNDVRFVSPLTQDKRTGLERFQISASVKVKEEGLDG